ncbi:hypothetical protein QQF64_006363 [Cirrhinus molitorella]|uniref:Uncharacterized protein n=1 Tax=Cirrhinus molitorella TaxID=172907 RepID=A0ABR3MHZ0_9TELE
MKSARSLWEQRDFSHSRLAVDRGGGGGKENTKKQKRGLLRAWPQALKPQPCYYCTSAEKRSQTGHGEERQNSDCRPAEWRQTWAAALEFRHHVEYDSDMT